jgi:alanine-glyoxylate transaminase/serine-glyoxylate transaminase/serine-pyruvate transaminase
MVHPRVLRALSSPLLGHLDPAFLALMDEIQDMLRAVFQTENRFTIAVSGTGSAGMEAALVNIVEPGDTVLIGMNGLFGTRMASIVERCGGRPVPVEAAWGRSIEPAAIAQTLEGHGPVKAVAIVQAETSTGVWQSLEQLGALCHAHGALFVVDAVTSLGGLPVEVDARGIDVCYSGTQKCLSCPPGLAPLTCSERAMQVIRQRKTRCTSWYLDFMLIADYWADGKRAYHHTAPVSMLYGLREALRLVLEEGLENRFARHQRHSAALLAGLEVLGFTPLPPDQERLPTLLCMKIPPHLSDADIRGSLLRDYGIEIGGGLGSLKGTVWRIGLMGESSTRDNVMTLLGALDAIFLRRGWIASAGLSTEAAARVLAMDESSVTG